MSTLRCTEIFLSLQGESRSTGYPTVFVRLTGCPLRCQYCDTAYAFSGGSLMTIDEILDRVRQYGTSRVTVTGGEPLAQPNCLELLTALADEKFDVSLETSGALDIERVDSRVSRVVDVKTPGSGECEQNRFENLFDLRSHDQVKFVICDYDDYEWSRTKVAEYDLCSRVDDVLFSPSAEQQDPTDLANWIVRDRLPVRMQVQLHKILWGNVAGK